MTHFRSLGIALALLVLAVSAAIAQPGYRSYRGGNCSGPVWASWRDANINMVQTRDGNAFTSGPYTTIAVTQLRTPYIPGPTVPGHCAEEVVRALQELANQGYYTVDVAVYRSGGWLISGNRNREQERRVAEEQARRAETARQRQYAQRSRQENNRTYRTEQTQTGTARSSGATSFLVLVPYHRGCNCGFGDYIKLRNNSDSRTIRATIQKVTYSTGIGDVAPKYLKETVAPGEEVEIGCTRFGMCQFENGSATYTYNITGATFVD